MLQEGESSEQKLRELDSQIATTAKSLATKDEQLKEITQRLEEVHKENASLLSKCSALEGNLERESSKVRFTLKFEHDIDIRVLN